ncbi:helix-turn-helix domain-containing protein [Streptomyces sp. LHD-70]|uniref:helix-turn-helix domain-containing protein n=1 Tax=Streptomyces sp. LHD-70 TaxID=3072140 RepID=UPI00280C7864|nr:helix-turn-helix domain-containing protein [Streptomyces sp. LHD-70]MDQ8704692.1 helix-turn-helix domain-containing protein [Streptomyces sp. LHD-70]
MTASVVDRHEPHGADEAEAAAQALRQVKEYLSAHASEDVVRALVEGEPDSELLLPRGAVELLATVLAHMSAGRTVAVVPAHAELTTQQAADLLNVSRPYLIGLLESGEIEYRTVGTHRRIKAESLLDYRRRDDHTRRAAADELTSLNQEMGLL